MRSASAVDVSRAKKERERTRDKLPMRTTIGHWQLLTHTGGATQSGAVRQFIGRSGVCSARLACLPSLTHSVCREFSFGSVCANGGQVTIRVISIEINTQ